MSSNSIKRPLIIIIFAVIVIILTVTFMLASNMHVGFMSILSDQKIVYLLPKDYKGWVTIKYKEEDCSSLQNDGEVIYIHISEQGNACTSDDFFTGWSQRVYKYEQEPEMDLYESGLVHAMSIIKNDKVNKVELFFVGNKELLNDSWKSKPNIK